MTNTSNLSDTLLCQASAWLIRLRELGVGTTPEFEVWRTLSLDHEHAWVCVQAPWRYLGEQATAPELIAMRGAALDRARRAGRARWRDRHATPFTRLAGVAAATALVALIGAVYVSQLPTTYRTTLAERRVVTLEDGSTVSLDSQSQVSVRYTKHTRELVLVRGQARFDVAHDVERPFSVQAADRKIIATGTSFDVDLVDHQVIVTLIEGNVVVLDRRENGKGAPHDGAKLEPGERFVAAPQAIPSIQHVNLERAGAWQTGQLVFEDETLASAVERVNRYSRHPVSVRDPAAAAMRFSGVFNEGDTRDFIDTVTRYLPLEADARADGSVELKRRD